MALVEVICSRCKKKYFRPTGRVNEAKKFGWKQYCSRICQYSAKIKRIKFKCGNPDCNQVFFREPSDIPSSKICFCSRSCAAKVNNPKSSKRRLKIRVCPNCGQKFTGRRKYCSLKCYPKPIIISKEQIIKEVRKFYLDNGRIPFKKEYFHWKAARSRFGTWNKAIKAAGLKPNPVKFAKKYIANDGHKCDSLSEKIIDDWLYARKIPHQRNIRYLGTDFTADFKVMDVFIEFFGLSGELKTYDKLMKKKLKIIKDNRLKLISIYPKDLFPKSRLDYVLKDLINLGCA